MARKAKIQKVKNKGSQPEMLPNRHAMSRLVRGDLVQRSMNNYAKLTPGVGQETPSIVDMSTVSYE